MDNSNKQIILLCRQTVSKAVAVLLLLLLLTMVHGCNPSLWIVRWPPILPPCQLCAALRVGLFQQKIQSTVAKADRSEPYNTYSIQRLYSIQGYYVLFEQIQSQISCVWAIFWNINFHMSPQIAYLSRCKFTLVACVWFSQMWVFTCALKSPSWTDAKSH